MPATRWTIFLTSLLAAGSWRLTAMATIAVEVCHDPETGPERHLADVGQLPIVPVDPPPVPEFPDPSLPGLWLGEVIVCLLLAVAAMVTAVALQRRRRAVFGYRVGLGATTVTALGALALGLGAIGTENMIRGRDLSGYLEAAHGYWQRGDHEQADARLLAAGEGQHRSLLSWVIPFYRSGLERVDVDGMRTANGISAVHQAIERQDAAAAERVLGYFEPDGIPATEARIAVLSHRSQWLLAAGEPADAVAAALAAHRLHWGGERIRSNLCVARYHLTVGLARGGRPAAAYRQVKLLEPPDCQLEARHRAVARGLVARSFAENYLGADDSLAVNTAGAVEMFEEAYRFGEEHGHAQDLPFLGCDLVAALNAHAVVSLKRQEPAAAVAALDRSDRIIPGQAFVTSTLPPALYALGNRHLAGEDFGPAIAAMERGYHLTEGRVPLLVEGLAGAHFAFGASQFEGGEINAAIDSFETAHGVDRRNRSIRRALADALLVRGDERLKVADPDAARPDFERAAQVSRERRATAQMRLRFMEHTPHRLARLAAKPRWFQVPKLLAEVPRDVHADGVAEAVLYYGTDPDRPVAIGELAPRDREPRQLHVLDEDNAVVMMLRDHNGDGELDERTTYSGQSASRLIIDVDRDRSPDLRLEYREGVEVGREPLSGRVLMVMHEGVVGDLWMDFFTQADAYVKLYHNGELQFVSDTVQDSNFPIWNQGVVVDYVHQDTVRLELWDEDVAYDDLIDVYMTTSLPQSGIYAFRRDKAAIRMSVTPSDLPPGHETRIDAPEAAENYFRDHPAAVQEYGDLIARARTDAVRAEVMRLLAQSLINTGINMSSRDPVLRWVLKVIAGIAMDELM